MRLRYFYFVWCVFMTKFNRYNLLVKQLSCVSMLLQYYYSDIKVIKSLIFIAIVAIIPLIKLKKLSINYLYELYLVNCKLEEIITG